MTDFKEQAILQLYPGKGGWHFVVLPSIYIELAQDKFGKKITPIVAKVGKTEWSTSIFPTKENKAFVAIKASVRKAENINEGDTVEISFRFKN